VQYGAEGCVIRIISQGAVPRKEREDWGADSVTARKESDAGDGLRKGATLTSGPAMSATAWNAGVRARARPLARLGPSRDVG
jgi:hypothetical protein